MRLQAKAFLASAHVGFSDADLPKEMLLNEVGDGPAATTHICHGTNGSWSPTATVTGESLTPTHSDMTLSSDRVGVGVVQYSSFFPEVDEKNWEKTGWAFKITCHVHICNNSKANDIM